MANTKIPVELSSTPGIVDNSNATAITIDSSENVGIGTSSPNTPDYKSYTYMILHKILMFICQAVQPMILWWFSLF